MTTGPFHRFTVSHTTSEIRAVFVLGAFFMATVLGVSPAQAQTHTVLYSFTETDGPPHYVTLVRDAAGNLYGTTELSVFRLAPNGNETALHFPKNVTSWAGLVRDEVGNFYGTTISTIFKINQTGLTVLHDFTGLDGSEAMASLVRDSTGNLYGTTLYGGSHGLGNVFKLDPNGTMTVLHSFSGVPDGARPMASLVLDSTGNLYGTTMMGGTADGGTVFKVDVNGNETVLYGFTGGKDGYYPYAGLLWDPAGVLYGTTSRGGAAQSCHPLGCGTIFKVDITSGKETRLFTFGATSGKYPVSPLIADGHGNLYGTTLHGGDPACPADGCGTVFKFNKEGATILYRFTRSVDGFYPQGGLVRDAAGNLYGTTSAGGSNSQGTVFKISP